MDVLATLAVEVTNFKCFDRNESTFSIEWPNDLSFY